MASLNKCFFIGNLTRDVELKYLTSGEAVANASIACNESYKNKSGEKVESVEFVNLVFYRRLAEVVGEYCKKGASIHVEGKMKTRKWQTKEGQDRYSTEIIVDQMQMLSGKSAGGDAAEHHPGAKDGKHPGAESKPEPAKGSGFDNFDDDIPFNRAGACGLWRVM